MGAVAIFKGKLVKFLAKAGILVPARPDADRSAIPAAGETAFNTTANKLEVYDGTAWVQLGAGGGALVGPIYSRSATGTATKIYAKTASDALATRAVSTWTAPTYWPTTSNANSVCWSPELNQFLFLALGAVNSVAISRKGNLLSEILNLKSSRLY